MVIGKRNFAVLGAVLATTALRAQRPVATVGTEGVTVKGAISVANGRATLANNGEIAAVDRTAQVELGRGGTVEVCRGTTLHMARDATAWTASHPGDAGLMFSLDRGSFEAHYAPGAYSDVVLTPELRLLVSGPGQADLQFRVNAQGDTCVDNAGANAPYVVVSSLMDGGAYRVRPGQRVMFLHGSLNEVVDNEREACGCAPALPAVQRAGAGAAQTPADTTFPLAVSEGLEPPPQLAGGAPVVPNGEAHAQVTATLSSSAPLEPPPATIHSGASPVAASAPVPAPVAAPAPRRGLFGKVGHFFSRLFGAD